MVTEIKVSGMSCENCVRHVKKALSEVEGVAGVTLDLDSGLASVAHEGVEIEALVVAIESEGYDALVNSPAV